MSYQVFDSYPTKLAILLTAIMEGTDSTVYPDDKKQAAFIRLIVNLGDVEKTHEETNIPVRTLYEWKNKLKTDSNFIFLQYDARSIVIQDRYLRIRDKLVVQMERITDIMVEVPPRYLPDYTTAVSRLIDRLEKLEAIITKTGQYLIEVRVQRILEDDAASRLADPADSS